MRIQFEEEQKFNQWWLWIFLIPLGILPLFGIYKQLVLEEPFGDNPMSDLGLIVFTVLIYIFLAFLYLIKLSTHIDENGIQMRFFPLVKKDFKWKDIKNVQVITYGFVGGFGIRLWTKYGTVYNVKGNKGLAIELNNGKKYLIGTQKETELKTVIKKFKEKQTEY